MCSILVIDDEKGILTLIREALTRFGHQVEIATDGHEGIQKFDDGTYELVITDLRMPRIDGKGVLHHIRNSGKQHTPIIGITGTPWLLKDMGFDLILPKPFPLLDLVKSVKNLVAVAPPLRGVA